MPVAPAERCTQTVAQAGEVGGVGQVRGWWHVGQRGLPALSTPPCRTMDRPTKPTAAAPVVRFAAEGFTTTIQFDAQGLVLSYPGIERQRLA